MVTEVLERFNKIYNSIKEKEKITYNELVKNTDINRMSLINYLLPFILYEVVLVEKIGKTKLFILNKDHEYKYNKMINDIVKKKVILLYSK